MKRRGHPIVGAIGGIIFFLSLNLLLLTTGTINLGSILLLILPAAGLVLGIILGLVAPFGKKPGEV